jgi:hypothetical protein
VQKANDVTVQLGGLPLGPPEVTVAPLDSMIATSTGRIIAVIIGSRFFQERLVDLDFAQRLMRVSSPKTFAYSGSGSVISLEFFGGVLPLVRGRLVTPDRRIVEL